MQRFFLIASKIEIKTDLSAASQGGSGSLNERKTHMDTSCVGRKTTTTTRTTTRIDRSRSFHVRCLRDESIPPPLSVPSHILSCGFTMLHAAFRLRRRTVKQRKSKSRSQGDKYRPTDVHTEHDCLRRVLRTKVKRDRAHANACGTKALFPSTL